MEYVFLYLVKEANCPPSKKPIKLRVEFGLSNNIELLPVTKSGFE